MTNLSSSRNHPLYYDPTIQFPDVEYFPKDYELKLYTYESEQLLKEAREAEEEVMNGFLRRRKQRLSQAQAQPAENTQETQETQESQESQEAQEAQETQATQETQTTQETEVQATEKEATTPAN